jgi:cyclophilin family peptidyl-prolyl cis-trans isomerase
VLLRIAPLALEKPDDYPAGEGVAHGLYALARARRSLGPLSPEAVTWLRTSLRFGIDLQETTRIRRLGWLAITANGTVDARDVVGTIAGDRDPQARRLAVAALPNVADTGVLRAQLERVRRDTSWLVRLEWVRVYRQRLAANDCGPLLAALSDPVNHVRLAAIDALGAPCREGERVIAVLRDLVERSPDLLRSRRAPETAWHDQAHALLALARADSAGARPLLRSQTRHPVWQVRMYVARGAAAARDTAVLAQLALDRIGSVREVALQGLANTSGHAADLLYVRALGSPDYHVVLVAAQALRGAPVPASVLPEVLAAIDRLTKERRQTSRDPRLELLARVREFGSARDVPRLTTLLKDHDEVIAAEAAAIIGHFTGSMPAIAPDSGIRPLVPASGAVRVRVTMTRSSGGGSFDLLLDGDRAPLTVARILSLIRREYYDGLTFHRVVPNFVLQGGSPGMNEYVGDGPFMRDELGLAHHGRGTVGISTRGRDTGDAQWFINMVDNYRLDHEYTVFATIVDGMDIVDRILEGDVMESVRIVTAQEAPGMSPR